MGELGAVRTRLAVRPGGVARIRGAGPGEHLFDLHNVNKINPPLVFSRADADLLLRRLDEVLRTI